ncbi:MAG: hypothetical protein ACTSRI_09320 [Promethearchaeota archaeon]
MIDKNELLKLLPKLIREDDEIKGAIITALSGVVATKEDIARLIELSNRRFEAMDKRFEAAREHRNDMEDNTVIIKEKFGNALDNMATKVDIENAKNEILDFLKKQFEDE